MRAQTPSSRLPERLNSVLWRLTFVCRQYETCFTSPFWYLEFWDGSQIFGKFVHSRVIYINKKCYPALDNSFILFSVINLEFRHIYSFKMVETKVISTHAMKTYRGLVVQHRTFTTSALDGDEWPSSHPGCFTPGKEPWVPIEQEAVWAPEQVWMFWKKK
jgi:hypothetical protein